MVRIGFTGDVMFGRLVDEHQRRRDPGAVWGDVLDRLRELDALVINLECTLSTRGEPWPGRPFHFRADPEWALPALRRAGVDACALANNHILDFGEPALRDTLDALEEAEIAHAGAGETVGAALEPAIVSACGLDVAVVSLTDNTPEYAADGESPGTARVEIDVDDPESRRIVGEALDCARRREPDLLVVSLHWGPNMVVEPPESFRAFARWLLERDVDVIYGHSAHVFEGIEIHDGRPILYDTGDFVDDYAVDDRLRNDRSFLFELVVSTDGTMRQLRLHPTEIYDYAVHEARPDVAEWSRKRMRELSAPFGTTFDRDGECLVVSLER